ncbi:GCN5-related N-acetyltransferase [Mycena floridula]|nr:GCN5-related N-acetyltransferase [Mycena floridula]
MTVTSAGLICRAITVADTLTLRHDVLWPDAPVSQVQLPEDEHGYHFGAFLEPQGDPVAVISLFLEDLPIDYPSTRPVSARFRKFACEIKHQGCGIGTKLLKHIFGYAKSELNVTVVWCDARTATLDWYSKRGMTSFGEKFFKSDVEYIRMMRDLDAIEDI